MLNKVQSQLSSIFITLSGAFGKVYRGELRQPGNEKFEDVAIKTIKSELFPENEINTKL